LLAIKLEKYMKILIADDKKSTRFMLKKYITDWGHTAVEASDGDKAWEVLNQEDGPRIAILDWIMPEINGVQICARLNDRKNLPFIYTILMTSKNSEQDLIFALENGAHNFQTKPISPGELHSYINVGIRLVQADDKLKEYAEKMEHLARIDHLTNVNNRRYFFEESNNAIKLCSRHNRDLSVLMLDIDHFKHVNDQYGHAAGDQVLKNVAKTCKINLRSTDIIGRIGGEEFAITLPETNLDDAQIIAEKMRKFIEEMVSKVDENCICVTASFGATVMNSKDNQIDDLLHRSDEALYEAKENGRNRVSSLCVRS
jgi:diguanylate cyclase (GGDEF)-like protein